MNETRTIDSVQEGRRYRVQRVLGRGGFGTVYKAELLGEGGFRKAVALKVLNPEIAGREDIARRLRDEARILGLLRHRALVVVDGLAKLDGRWTVVMEYVDGVDLCKALGQGPMPVRAALEVTAEIASVLHVGWHTTGPTGAPLCLLHRDIKPSNVQLTRAGEVKLLDFGIARAEFAAREAETQGQPYGTPGYIAPERFEGKETPKGDIYALGVVLYEMLSGMAFGLGSGNPERHEAIVKQALEDLDLQGAPELIALLEQMLACDPAMRPDARALGDRCEALIERADGERLRGWAEHAVPQLMANQSDPPSDPITGQVLTAHSEATRSSPTWPRLDPVQAPLLDERSPRLPWLPLVAGVIGAVVLIFLLSRPVVEPELATAVPAVAATTPAPPEIAPPEPSPADATQAMAPVPEATKPATVAQKPAQKSTPKSTPTATPIQVIIPPPPAEPQTGTVTVSDDDGLDLRLISGDQRHDVGTVPVGTWTLQVRLPNQSWSTTTTRVVVTAGSTVTLRCNSAGLLCKVER